MCTGAQAGCCHHDALLESFCLPDEIRDPGHGEPPPKTDVWDRLPPPLTGPGALAAAFALTGLATLAGAAVAQVMPHNSVSLVYLVTVALAAVGLGLRTGLAVSLAAFLAYNFFFIPPVFSFTIADPEEVLALLVFLGVGLLTGSLAGRMREVADDARRRARALQSLNDFAAKLSASRDGLAILDALAGQAAHTADGSVVVLIPEAGTLEIRAASSEPPPMTSVDVQAAQRAYRTGEVEHRAAVGWRGAQFEFHPLKSKTATLGVVGIAPGLGERGSGAADLSSVQIMLHHAAIALERAQLETDALHSRGEMERERLRSALLSSLSHDLKTPLASILGAVTSLRELGPAMSADSRADLLAAIEEETRRLSRFVANLLQMARLESGDLGLLNDWIDLADVVRIAVSRGRRLAPEMTIDVSCPSMLPPIKGDATLVETVIFNLLDNAIKFSGRVGRIEVVVSAGEGRLSISITDQGRGIPPEALQRVFEPFYRVNEGDGEIAGTGLGLAICKQVIDGMGGSILAHSPLSVSGGSRIEVKLPVPEDADRAQSNEAR
jgi:two-component system sensor histidine kinase KdpD